MGPFLVFCRFFSFSFFFEDCLLLLRERLLKNSARCRKTCTATFNTWSSHQPWRLRWKSISFEVLSVFSSFFTIAYYFVTYVFAFDWFVFVQNSVFLAKEFERIRAQKPSIKFSSRRTKATLPEKQDDVEGCHAAVNSATVELNYLNGRLLHLQLLSFLLQLSNHPHGHTCL